VKNSCFPNPVGLSNADMATRVNLDALVRREDFDETVALPLPQQGKRKESISVTDLQKGQFFFPTLRKPDFQRETNDWDTARIIDLITSFLNKDLIPAIILWQNESNLVFVIDGSHRLSALAAWINDDYGDGDISRQLNDGKIPDEQIAIGNKIRGLINKSIGSYKDHQLSATHPEKVRSEIAARSRILGTVALPVQWVEGNSTNAENSFKKINEQGVPINSTEKKILNSRRKPIGFASRAIIRGGQGHNYWVDFGAEVQKSLKEQAKQVHELLFLPKLKNPIKTLELPLAGKVFSAQSLPIVWDFIRIVNPLDKIDANDPDGTLTLKFLDNCKKTAQRINSDDQSSLGLHPIVYVYSESGRHKPASLYAITDLILDFEKNKKFEDFICVREQFEKLLLENDYLIQQIVRNKRGALSGYEQVKEFYLLCIQKLLDKKLISQVIAEISQTKTFGLLAKPAVELPAGESKEFSRAVKSRAFIKTALEGAVKCKICGGYVHTSSVSIDHKQDKKLGGDASAENAQVTHPYCNSAKDKLLPLISKFRASS
jgi:hypothetical protein